MAFGKTLVVLLAAVAFASAQTHNPAYDPFYHPTGRPAQNALAGATSQNSPGFPQISKLLPLVQADNIGPTLNTATTKLVVSPTWDFSNPAAAPKSAAAGNPSLIFRPAATAAPTTQQGPGTPAPGSTSSGRKLLQTFPTNGTGSCVTDAPGLGAAAGAANAQACALAATFATNCTCAAANAGRKLLQALTFTGRQQFFGECKEDFFRITANCNYVFDAASAGLRANIQTGLFGNTFVSCTLFYDDGSFVTSNTCFSNAAGTPTVVRLNAQQARDISFTPMLQTIEYAKFPSTAGATTGQGAGPGTRISPETFLAANYVTSTGFAFTITFRPVQFFGVYINEDHAIYPGQ